MLSNNDIESELSYAYLHAVAAKAGMTCVVAGRHSDNRGVDARISAFGPFSGGYLTDVNIDIQLKATASEQIAKSDSMYYDFKGISQYDKLRDETTEITRILVVLFLPSNCEEWLLCSESELVLKRCAYWASLIGMPDTDNTTSIRLTLPRKNLLTPAALQQIADKIARRDRPRWDAS